MRGSSNKKIDPRIHYLVPKHEVLNIDEAYKILKELGIRPEQLPWIRASDPVARSINAKPGDIIRIIRKSQLYGEVVSYRYVISG
ncbi:DNA-directed RNA polymerase subunit H [Saccharolobus solfataricus]|uniref:DNA-directed RNA polymerase subunit Rpo5 n=3 Tax=Saccharolobus solfataricus TaxID=2287 RepID=RPO5_SACS2|nr:DNA-directed RNA polymerase subunit H [Saccharolobus solfataricus]Q980Q9.1 RecName: Full=DNA-directed RNA polymerase subunit Rpo5; AltName: Full=DNA-directed RNA polymerase subunit H [Saccharolobus solfataricus P2]2PMZ_H Chain H, DNA-directed RNA polymerase subunit H [Saccharolobus solfataricus P2]2PMZ_V Chain V, DNA-directed RNA polymerase subunit H [Saccharolobus solfataricus P2]3HKZ_H Chain H, DNA-directed RNA polymerase subunit H [Saccharolobus solfataricus P2]3HKZ_T Chain T, DNA-direct